MNSMKAPQLQHRRDQILEEMRALDHMRRGSLSRQFFRSRHPHRSIGPGPYFVLQGYLQGQKFSQRIRADQAAAVETHVANFKRFQALADEFVTVTEQLTVSAEPAVKKTSRLKSPGAVPGNHRIPPGSPDAMGPERGAESGGRGTGIAGRDEP